MNSPFPKNITFKKELKINDQEFKQLRDFIYEKSGIYIGDNRKYLLENRLGNRLKAHNLKSFGEYFYFLRYDAQRNEELTKLFEVITTNETSFFRNPPQIKVFQEQILRDLVKTKKAKGDKRIHVWSAGCSTGEEPYTLSIVLHEAMNYEMSSWKIKISAHDLSNAVLSAAKRGIYSHYALRSTPPEIVKKYFLEESPGMFRVQDKVKELVHFGQINLSDRFQLKKVERSDVIFCRNVIIYFDEDMKKNVINSFYDNLLPGGYMFIGHSESLHNISRAFKPMHYPGSIVYLKEK
ncbi:protein-glutamate O-methyltransferase CheR [Desulfonatronospira sp.]|uniref:CheR family methyltransferase n=1 Tax=Desulfonatronospira sp. TaxID=1962951 RepID=UPI0025C4B823|nr:protein-glutamate O-methyltransferase CheR [Desulfonatronospira sp.]